MSKTTKIGGRKKAVREKIIELAKKYPIIGVVDMTNLPTPQLQRMRSQLRGQIELFMANKRVIKKALEQLKERSGLKEITPYLEKAQPALLFTKENPFSLFKTIKKNKSKAPAKGGQTAPNDIIVPAGPTPFAPGPVIGELGALGIKSGVEGGKIAIKNDTVVCKEGSIISEKLASILTRLGIEPMEIGLDIKAVYEKGAIYTKKILDIDETKFISDLITAASQAYNLAIEAAYTCKETTEELIKKAFREAKALAKEGKVMCDLIAEELAEQAEREMLALKEIANIEIPEKKREEINAEDKPKEEPKKEQAKEEKKTEPAKETQKGEGQAHPKQGHVTHEQAADLLSQLKKEGTLRK